MTLNHVNLGVSDVPATVAMFVDHFGLRPVDGFPASPKMAFLTDDGGGLISLFKVPDPTYPKIFHVGFIRPSVAEVDAIHARLTAAGLSPEVAREEHGRYTFYVQAPGGFTVEVNAFLPREPRA